MTIEKTATFKLTIFSVPDFNLILPVSSGNAYAGQDFPIGIDLSSIDQFAGEIELSIEGLPAGVTVDFFPAAKVTIAPGFPKSVQATLHLPADNALVGEHDLTIKAVSTAYNGQ
jgi:hypothetical protein